MIFRPRSPQVEPEQNGEIFAPVADLMVGVVFVVILLVLGLVLRADAHNMVPRTEYDKAQVDLAAAKADANAARIDAANARREAERERASVRGLSRLGGFVRDRGVIEALEAMARADQVRAEILLDIQRRLAAAGVTVSVDPVAGTLALPAGNLFSSGQSDPLTGGRETLLKVGRVLSEVLPCHVGQPGEQCSNARYGAGLTAVYLEGHTDIVPYGASTGRFRNNWDLSAGRAIEAFTLLRERFESLRELRNTAGQPQIGVSGYAETRPAQPVPADRSTDAVRDRDRRIELRLVVGTDSDQAAAVLKALREEIEGVRLLLP